MNIADRDGIDILAGDADAEDVYASLGVSRVINAAGAYTLLGGSMLSPGVRRAMDDANRSFVDMRVLLESSGRIIADMLGAEAALVTSGAAAALVLGAAACMTKEKPEKLEQLPDVTGIPHEFLTQRLLRQKYDRCITIAGAKLVDVGDSNVTAPEQLRAAIGANTAGVHYFVPANPLPGMLPLEAAIEIAHEHDLPVIVDAAGMTYPLDNMRRFTRMGADLVCYAGKYFEAPHSTGLLVGRSDLVDLAMTNSFIGFETSGYLTIGRTMKVDRQEVVGCVVALQEWFAMDQEARLQRYAERIELLLQALKDVAGIEAHRISERETPRPVIRDGVRIVPRQAKGHEAIISEMRDGEPSVWLREDDDHAGTLNVSVAFCSDGEFEVVVQRLREVLGAE